MLVVETRPDGSELQQCAKLFEADGSPSNNDTYRPYDFSVLMVNSFEQWIGSFDKDNVTRGGLTYLDALISQQIVQRTSVFAGVLEKLFEQLTQHLTFDQAASKYPEIANFMEFYRELKVFMKTSKK